MSNQLRDCPEDYYDHCRNAGRKCQYCSAGFGSEDSKLFYSPVTKSGDISHIRSELVKHPYEEKRDAYLRQKKFEQKRQKLDQKRAVDAVKSKQVREALSLEKKLTRKIAQQTLRSGAINGDGDIKLLEGLFQVDAKRRFTTKNFSVSWKEYEAGLQQGTNQWIVTVEDEQKKEHTMVCMTLDSYLQLFAIAAEMLQDRSKPS